VSADVALGPNRSGVEHLSELQTAGSKIGLRTNKAPHNVRISELEARTDIKFDAVLCNAQCVRPSVWHRRTCPSLGDYDLLKPVSRFFKSTVTQ
jgi:hypothetical protein